MGRRGFTLVEVVIFVAVLSVIASAGYVTLVSTREAATENKLSADTAHVNEVLQIYMANGGALPSSYTSGTMVALLKTRADATSAAATMGLTGSYLDARTVAIDQTADEAATTQARAVWTGSGYTVQQGPGPIGIKQFNLVEGLAAAAPVTASRDPGVLGVNTNKQWIWDYNDHDPVAVATGTTPSTGDRTAYNSGTAALASSLSAPGIPNVTIPLLQFGESGTSVTLSSSNPSGISQIYYSTSAGVSDRPYTGAFAVDPNTVITAYAKSLDPDHYSTSSVASGTIKAIPVTLALSLTATNSVTYAQAGGLMTTSNLTAPNATVALTNSSSIPLRYISSGKFQTYYSYGSASLTAAATSFSGVFASPQITLNISQWTAGATSLTIKAQLRALDSTMFISSATASVTVNTTTTSLAAPTITPVSGQRTAAIPITIAYPSGNLPQSARIYYTLDGTDPGDGTNGPTPGEPKTSSLSYSGSVNSGTNTNGGLTVTARVYGPTGYGQWFAPSSAATTSYTSASFPDGALIGSATLNGTFVGSLMYAAPTSGSMGDITFNGNAKILSGNLYLPGTPTVKLSNGTVWSAATDSAFAAYIQGWEYDANGVKTVQTTPRVINDTGAAAPTNYTVLFNTTALLEGKIVRRHTPPAFPTVAAPPSPDSNVSKSLDSHPTAPISASGTSSITLNTSAVGDVSLNAGNFGDLTANNGTSFVLGDPLHPDVVQVYSFRSLNLNSGASLKIVGKVILTVAGNINVNNGSVVGNSAHSDWLQLAMSSSGSQFQANSGSSVYAELVAPTSSVTFNAGSVFHGSVTALSLTINSNGVVFDQPPVMQN